MKKMMILLVCAVLALGTAACRQKSQSTEKKASSATTDSAEASIIQKNVTDTAEMTAIKTAYGDLSYPSKWDKDVTFTVSDQQVDAACGKVKLFSLYFGGSKGEPYGVLHADDRDIDLLYEMYDIDPMQERADDLSAMQEDINVIFYCLEEEGKLTIPAPSN